MALAALQKLLPKDAYCMIGITMQDIYSGDLTFECPPDEFLLDVTDELALARTR